MSITNIYEYLVSNCGDMLSHLMCESLDGDASLQVYSDYEKFRAVCRLAVRLSGNLQFKCISDALRSCIGESAEVCEQMCDSMWTGFYRERLGCSEDESASVGCSWAHAVHKQDELILHIAFGESSGYIDIGDMTEFVRPDIYHVCRARDKMLAGEQISREEKNLLAVQRVREDVSERGTGRTAVFAGDCPIGAVVDTVRYIRREFSRANILAVFDADRICDDTSELACMQGVVIGARIRKSTARCDIQRVAESLAIGNTVLVLQDCCAVDIESVMLSLMSEWSDKGTAPRESRVRLKNIEPFI